MSELTIGEVARNAGIRPSAIRYYEEIGILPEAERVGGQRRYGNTIFDRLKVIQMAQEAGFTIAEIRTLFDAFEPGTPASERWRALSVRKIGEIDALIDRAELMRHVLQESLRCECLTLDECAGSGWEMPR
jgi:MerR family transcriptional regulator, redox-sensitive transcriptional activator SoxR